MKHIDFSLIVLLVSFFVGASNLFIDCFFGKLATESFLEMADCLFESDWQSLSIEFQKYFILMISNAQIPLYYHGFGLAVLNLETFSNVRTTLYISAWAKQSFWTYLFFSWCERFIPTTWFLRGLHPIKSVFFSNRICLKK